MNNVLLSPDDKKKLDTFILHAVHQLEEMDSIREALKDQTKNVAEELGYKPKYLTKAVRAAHKKNLAEAKEELAEIEDILNVTGHA